MKPEEGLIYKRLEEVAEKLNIHWEKSEYAKRILSLWIDKVVGVDDMPPPPSHFPSGPPPTGGFGGGGAGGGGNFTFDSSVILSYAVHGTSQCSGLYSSSNGDSL